jgi:acyl-CoA thioesterase-1
MNHTALSRRALIGGLLLCGTTARAEAPPKRIVTLGDSITKASRPGVTEDQTFSSLLQSWLRRDGFTVEVLNRGIGGERTDQALARLDTILALKPSLVTVMYGTNDSYVDPGRTESRLTVEQYRENLRELVRRLRDAGATPVLMTPPCWAKGAKNGLDEDPNVRLNPFVKAVREVAQATKAPLVDHWEEWMCALVVGEDVGSWTTDLCHPNPDGQERLAKRMLPIIRKRLERR